MFPVASGNLVLLGEQFDFWHMGSVSFFCFFSSLFSSLQRAGENKNEYVMYIAVSLQFRYSLTNSDDYFMAITFNRSFVEEKSVSFFKVTPRLISIDSSLSS